MAVLRWDPWGEFASLQRDVNALLNRPASPSSGRNGGIIPPIDAYRTEEALFVRVELPGLSSEDVEVSVDEGVLTIHGERAVDATVEDDAWVRRERAVGRFERGFSLPEGTDAAGITANFDRGVLELRIPHPPQRRPHRVEIDADGSQRQSVEVGAKETAQAG